MSNQKLRCNEFTETQIQVIRDFLIEHCKDKCISSETVFNALQSNIDLSKTKFCNLLSEYIRDQKIDGFDLRRGRGGGIHVKGLFDDYDHKRQLELDRPKRSYNKRPDKISYCDLYINDEYYLVKTSEAKLLVFTLKVLNGNIVNDNYNIIIGTIKVKTNHIDILERYIINCCGIAE